MKTPSPLELFLESLYTRRARGIKLGLETTATLLEAMGNPHRAVPVIHVAGTNGKGTVCALLHRVLTASGLRAGLYTSPHLVRFNERIRIGEEDIGDEVLFALLKEVDARANEVAAQPDSRQPTFFEFATVTAFTAFQRHGAELSVIETGLGGRLDATSVVDPLVSVITSIGIDHVGFLGGSLAGIAREKAGIIKPGRPVVVGRLDPESMEVVVEVAAERQAPLIRVEDQVAIHRKRQSLSGQVVKIETPDGDYPSLTYPFLGPAQIDNLAIAIATLEALRDRVGLPLETDAIVAGIESTTWPGRGQVLAEDPPTLLDAAHNPAGASALRRLLDDVAPKQPVALVMSFTKDKDAEGVMRELAGRAQRSWIVPMEVSVAMPVDDALAAARRAGLTPEVSSLSGAIEAATVWAKAEGGVVCIAGSVYLAGEVMALQT